jgi:8-oxo-dGTP pyrophosphatase MutT (NUDIX family)
VEEARQYSAVTAPVIRIAAAVILDGRGRVLLVRKSGTDAFMLPGGKMDGSEDSLAAMAREVEEELGCGIAPQPRPLGRFSAEAANEPGAVVEAELFAVELSGEAAPAAEIAEMLWHDPDDSPTFRLAPLARDHVLPMVRAWRRT